MRCEREANLVVATLGVEELIPGQNKSALQEDDFEPDGAFLRGCLP
jgi:hypothetical protein